MHSQIFLTAGVGLSGRAAGNGWAPSARGKRSQVLLRAKACIASVVEVHRWAKMKTKCVKGA